MFFRGYVQTRGKRCIEKFKDVQRLKTYDEVKDLPEFAGILNGQSILLDFDDADMAKVAFQLVQDMQLKCRVYQTNRGVHILFRNSKVQKCGTATRLACGLRADIKVGMNAYSVLKYKGQERAILYDSGVYEEVPAFFTPVSSPTEFWKMGSGDGRNQALFGYILTLQSHGLTKDEADQCIRLINKHVLAEALPERELNTILRDEAFEQEVKPVFFSGKTFLFDKFAAYVRDKAHIVKINKQLHIYKDGIYTACTDDIEREMVKHIPSLNQAKRTEVMRYLSILIDEDLEQSSERYIAFKNGIYDIVSDQLLPFSEKYVILNKINHNFNPAANAPLVDETLDKLACKDPAIRALLEEVVGYCFYRRNELGKAFVLVGDGSMDKGASNGKSTFYSVVTAMLGEENISSLDMKELNEKFMNAELFGKLANIGDDIDDGYIPSSAMFKKFVTGERVQVQRKGEKPFQFKNYAKMLFAANEIPKIKDRGGAIQRRLVIIPFLAHFSKNDPDYRPFITTELQEPECIEYLIQLGIRALKRVLENHSFTESDKVRIQLDEFEENNNPMLGFLRENIALEVENKTTTSVYAMYTEYCLVNHHKAMSKAAFSRQIAKRFGVETTPKMIDGKQQRVFTTK